METPLSQPLSAPDPSMKCISRYEAFKCWRVALPKGLGGRQVYFNDSDYGGCQQALTEAAHFRDEQFVLAGVQIHARVNLTAQRQASDSHLPIYETTDHRGTLAVRGRWMTTVAGKPYQRTVSRSCTLHGREGAWRQVEDIVKSATADEAERIASAERNGTLGRGDGAVGSRRLRKSG